MKEIFTDTVYNYKSDTLKFRHYKPMQVAQNQQYLFMQNATQNESIIGLQIEREEKKINATESTVESEISAKLTRRVNETQAKLQKIKSQQKGTAWLWDKIKNCVNAKSSYKRAEQTINDEIRALESGDIQSKFKTLTGVDYTEENIQKFLSGEIKTKSEEIIEKYETSQNNAVDTVADLASGILAVGVAGAVLALGTTPIGWAIALAAGVGAVTKLGIKAGNSAVSGKNYTVKNALKDSATGAVSGALGIVTGGLGGAFGRTVAAKAGVQVMKEGTEQILESGAKAGFKAMLRNPFGYKYAGKTGAKILTYTAEMATDGAVGGALDNSFRAAIDGQNVGEAAVSGFVGGLVMAPAIGGGLKLVGKGGSKIGNKFASKKQAIKEAQLKAEKELLDKYKDYELPNGYKLNVNIAKGLEADEELTLLMLKNFDNIPETHVFFSKKWNKQDAERKKFYLDFMSGIPEHTEYKKLENIIPSLKAIYGLKDTNPERYQYFINSEMKELIQKGDITMSSVKDGRVQFSPDIINLAKSIKSGEQYIKKLNSKIEFDNISKHVNDGDAFEFDNVLYVNNNGVAEKLNLSRKSFERLFPQFQSRVFSQGQIGDCVLVSFLDGLMSTPKGRCTVYKMFQESGDDIILTFNDANKTRIIFDKGNVMYINDKFLGDQGENAPLGLQMIEQGFACKIMGEVKKKDLTDFHINNLSDYVKPQKLPNFIYGIPRKDVAEALLGKESKRIGKKDNGLITILRSRKKQRIIHGFLEENANENSNVISVAFIKQIRTIRKIKKYKLYAQHEYTIKGCDTDKGVVYISNPHNTAYTREVPLDFITKYAYVDNTEL